MMYSYIFSIIFLIFITFPPSIYAGQPIECNKPNEHYECGSACQKTCDNIGETCPIINKKCNDACYCDEGYARNSTKDCIPIEKCPAKNKCGKNEYYGCGNGCQTECDKLGQCSNKTDSCIKDCYCSPGYARNQTKQCIPIKECPNMPLLNCDNPHEHYECGSACQTTCENYGQICPIINIRCNDDCYCDDSYARDCNGRCIPVWQCPKFNDPKKCSRDNEHYQFDGACDKYCGALDKPCKYLGTHDGCYCNEGYARDKYGNCIAEEDCPSDCCPCPESSSESSSESDSDSSCGCK